MHRGTYEKNKEGAYLKMKMNTMDQYDLKFEVDHTFIPEEIKEKIESKLNITITPNNGSDTSAAIVNNSTPNNGSDHHRSDR
ncbi:hypothetical protein U1Q18_051791 [Sarracenia purpurea var. burkii]